MNSFRKWSEWVYAIGWTLLHFLWQGALVGAAYAAARMVLRAARPQARYVLGLVALVVLAALPAITLWQLAPAAAARTLTGPIELIATAPMAAIGEAPAGSIEPLLPWLVGAWLVGVALFSLRTLYQYLRLRRLCQRGAEPLPEWEDRLRLLAARFEVTRPVRLVRSTIVQTPSLIGWLKPVIVLPTSVLLGLTPQQIELVIAHELGHIRRWDYAVNLLQIAIETVLFYHPVVHWISREVREEREACCDDLVLHRGADPVDYAAALAGLEELRGVTHAPALAASGGFLLGRIRRIVGAEPMFATPLSGGQGVMVAALALAAVLSVRPVTHEVIATAVQALPETPVQTLTRAAGMAVERLVAPTVLDDAGSKVAAKAEGSDAPAIASAALAPDAVAHPRIALAAAAPVLPIASSARAGMSDFKFELERAVPAFPAASQLPLDEPGAGRALAIETVQPFYPRRAAIAGVEGQVTLSFRLDRSGRARDIRVAERTGASEFEREAMSALRRWRFASEMLQPGRRYVQTFDFALAGVPSGRTVAPDGGACRQAVGSRICKRVSGAADEGQSPAEAAFRDAWSRSAQHATGRGGS